MQEPLLPQLPHLSLPYLHAFLETPAPLLGPNGSNLSAPTRRGVLGDFGSPMRPLGEKKNASIPTIRCIVPGSVRRELLYQQCANCCTNSPNFVHFLATLDFWKCL